MLQNIGKQLAKIAMNKDKELAVKQDLFIEENSFQYELAINLWLLIIDEYVGLDGVDVVTHYIRNHGLVAAINEASSLANACIRGDSYSSPFRVLLLEDEAKTLQCLRFLKRFCPIGADRVLKSSLDAFLKVNEACKGDVTSILFSKGWKRKNAEWILDCIPYEYGLDSSIPSWLINMVRVECYDILGASHSLASNSKSVIKKCTGIAAAACDWEHQLVNGEFSNGATAVRCQKGINSRGLAHKLDQWAHNFPYFLDIRYPFPENCDTWQGNYSYPTLMPHEQYNSDSEFIAVQPVPKSYKAARIIAMTNAFRGYMLQSVRKDMIHALEVTKAMDYITLDDQGNNQYLAFLGSVTGCVGTIDLSSASDSISDHFAKAVLPQTWYNAVNMHNSRTMRLPNGERVRRWIFQTSGNPTTFVYESVIFLAIARAAVKSYCLFTGIPSSGEEFHRLWSLTRTYGDDLIIPIEVYETLVDFLILLRFHVNHDKSFGWGTDYRESCGVEYRSASDVHSVYFPRHGLELSKHDRTKNSQTLASLIAMQHELYGIREVRLYLTDFCKSYALRHLGLNNITFSERGTDCADLWGPIDLPVIRYCRHNGPVNDWMIREAHSALVKQSATINVKTLTRTPSYSYYARLLDLYYYVKFLKDGPRYESALDELLNISAAPRARIDDIVSDQQCFQLIY